VIKRIKIVFIGSISSSFIKNDYETLTEYFDVDIICPPKKKIGWLRFIFIAARKIKQCDAAFSWFAGPHSAFAVFFSKLFKKKSIVVVGGYDAAYFPEINYGAFTNIKEKIPAKYVYKNVDKILVVAPALKENIIKNAKVIGNNIDYLPTGFNPDYWKPGVKKENVVLTVAMAKNMLVVKLKGLDVFVKAAANITETKFILVGVKNEAKRYLSSISSKNVELIEFLPRDRLLQHYQMAKVYCQLSLDEGLPTALCEAMLCGCIPVGSRAAGVITAIGDTGLYVEYGDEKGTADMIKKALDSRDNLGKKARERIKNSFPETRRKEELKKLILEMVNSS
jgi:glycosyltransferase involved in cell wall biosynthesis